MVMLSEGRSCEPSAAISPAWGFDGSALGGDPNRTPPAFPVPEAPKLGCAGPGVLEAHLESRLSHWNSHPLPLCLALLFFLSRQPWAHPRQDLVQKGAQLPKGESQAKGKPAFCSSPCPPPLGTRPAPQPQPPSGFLG